LKNNQVKGLIGSIILVTGFLFGCATAPITDIGTSEDLTLNIIEFTENPYITVKIKRGRKKSEVKVTILDHPAAGEIKDKSLSMPFVNYLDKDLDNGNLNDKVRLSKALLFSALSFESYKKIQLANAGAQYGLLGYALAATMYELEIGDLESEFIYKNDSVVCMIEGTYLDKKINVHLWLEKSKDETTKNH